MTACVNTSGLKFVAAHCALALLLLAGVAPVQAQVWSRAYASEDLRRLSIDDQSRVIALEYEEQSGGDRIPDDQLRFYLDQANRSDWTFSRIRADIAESLRRRDHDAPGGPVDTIRCESTDLRDRTCPTPWEGPSRLVRQLSDTPCEEGRNFSSRPGEVTVRSGCRAEFAPVAGRTGPQVIRCESHDRRERTCATPWRGRTRMVRELSETGCVEGRNWSFRPGEVTVWGGCRAEFADARGGWPEESRYSVTCASRNRRYTTCHWAPGDDRPRLIEQLSREVCIRGESWGLVDRNTIWVTHGCRARFGN